jgi:outer membrane immunogenic protein
MKSIIKTLLLAGVSAVAIVGTAAAADLRPMYTKAPPPPPPAFSWTGFYVGVNAGWGWNDTSGDTFCTDPGGITQGTFCPIFPQGNLQPSGGFGGGQIGYNLQNGQFVYGIEADIQGADISDSFSMATLGVPQVGGTTLGPGTFSQSQKLDWFGTVRGRLGWTPWDRTLLYLTGGLIYGHESVSGLVALASGATYAASDSSVRIGGTVGGGVEYAFSPRFTGRIEGLYYDMGSETITAVGVGSTGIPTGFTQSSTFNYRGGLVRGAVNFKFGP